MDVAFEPLLTLIRAGLSTADAGIDDYLTARGLRVVSVPTAAHLCSIGKPSDIVIASTSAVASVLAAPDIRDVIVIYPPHASEAGLRALEAGAADSFPSTGLRRELSPG